jgi:hypothetical protein
MEKNDVCSLCHTPSNLQPEFADAAAMAGSANMPLRAVGARVRIEPQLDNAQLGQARFAVPSASSPEAQKTWMPAP